MLKKLLYYLDPFRRLREDILRSGVYKDSHLPSHPQGLEQQRQVGLGSTRQSLNKYLLDNYKMRLVVEDTESSGWFEEQLQSYKAARAQEQSQEEVEQDAERIRSAVVAMINRIGNTLSIYADCFNRRASSGVLVELTEPAFVTEELVYGSRRRPLTSISYYRMRLTLRTRTIVVRGFHDSISIFLMPANEVLGLSRAEANYRPILDLHAHMVGPHLLWSREQSPFSDAEVGSLSRWLFNELINAWACEQEQVQTKTDWRFSQIRALGDALVALARRLGRSSLAGPKTVPLRAVAH